MDYVIGIDCGGTKTLAVAYDRHQQQCFVAESGPGNIVINKKETIERVIALTETIQSALEGKCLGITIGIAGIDTTNAHEELQHIFSETFDLSLEQVLVVSDAKLGLLANLKGEDGIFAIAGTGSVVYGLFDETFYRIGGWGHLFGDEGSAYWIAKQFYLDLIEAENHQRVLLPYQKAILAALEVTSTKEAVAKAYQMDKSTFASLTAKMAAQTTIYPEVSVFFAKAGLVLADQVKLLLSRVEPLPANIHLAGGGSVLLKNDIVRQTMLDTLADRYHIHYLSEKQEATFAAWIKYFKPVD